QAPANSRHARAETGGHCRRPRGIRNIVLAQKIEPDTGSLTARTEIQHRPFSAEGAPRLSAHLTASTISYLSALEFFSNTAHPKAVQLNRDHPAWPNTIE